MTVVRSTSYVYHDRMLRGRVELPPPGLQPGARPSSCQNVHAIALSATRVQGGCESNAVVDGFGVRPAAMASAL